MLGLRKGPEEPGMFVNFTPEEPGMVCAVQEKESCTDCPVRGHAVILHYEVIPSDVPQPCEGGPEPVVVTVYQHQRDP